MSKNPGTHVRTASGPGRSLHYPSLRGGSPKRRLNADRRMYGGEKSDVTIVATKPANNAWMTTGRSRWSQGSHPRGKREAGFMPDSGPDFVNLVQWLWTQSHSRGAGVPLTAGGGYPHFLTSCATARPAGGAVCVTAHARICAGPQGKPWGYRDEVARCGRARWKIENECFKRIARHGQNFKHNFGHGKNGLANLLATLNLLAFAVHTTLDQVKGLWKQCRASYQVRRDFFEALRARTIRYPIPNWRRLWESMLFRPPPLLAPSAVRA